MMKYRKGEYIKVRKKAVDQSWYIDKPFRIIGFSKNKHNKPLYIVNHTFIVNNYKINMILDGLVEQDDECLKLTQEFRKKKIKRLIK